MVMDPTRPSTATNGNIPGRTPCTSAISIRSPYRYFLPSTIGTTLQITHRIVVFIINGHLEIILTRSRFGNDLDHPVPADTPYLATVASSGSVTIRTVSIS